MVDGDTLKTMKPKITVILTPIDGYGTWIDEFFTEEQLLSLGGNRAGKEMPTMRRFVTIAEMAQMEYNPDFIQHIKDTL